MRLGTKARVFFSYSKKQQGAVEILGESSKKQEKWMIKNIKQNYQ